MEYKNNQPMVPEHAAPKKDESDAALQQTDAEKEAVSLNEKLFAKAKKARGQYDKDWTTLFRYFRGDQWRQKRPSYRHSEVLNIVTANVRNVVPILTDPRPNITTTPEDPTDYEFSQILNHVLSSKWDRDNCNMVVAEAVIDACVIGTAIGHVPWIAHLDRGIGDFVFETEDPAHCFPDPVARDMNDRFMKFFTTAVPTDVAQLKEEYPDKAQWIKPDLKEATVFNSYTDEAQEFAFKSPVDNRMMIPDSRTINPNIPDLALKLTSYIQSEEVCEEEHEVTDPQSGKKSVEKREVKKYPNGRKIVSVGPLLLEDGPNPYEDGKVPYARLVNDILPRSFWGESDIGPQKSPQDITNKLISYLLDYLIIMGNPIWVVDDESMVDVDNMTNEPGMKVVKKQGTEVRREQGISPPPFIMNTLQYMIGDIFSKISGQNEISQGALSKAQLSGEAIAQLTEASQTRLRAKSRNLDCFLNQVGYLEVSRILQYYDLPRVVRIDGPDSAAPQYFKFHVKKVPNENGGTRPVGVYQKFQHGVTPGTGQWSMPKEVPMKSELDIRITTGTALPFMKAKRDEQAERFFDKGILDAEDLLGTIEYPKREQIIEKWKRRQAEMAAANQGGGANGGNAASG